MDLMTHQEYDRYLKEKTEPPFLIVVKDAYRRFGRHGTTNKPT
ncbi:hypothetical protein [Spirosoma areae]